MRAAAIALVATCVLLAGCNGIKVPKTVEVPIPVPCIKERVERPFFVTDAQLAGMTDYALVLALAADRLERQGYERKLEAVIAGCR
jgi:hypothetical protein